jgi:TonB family protein
MKTLATSLLVFMISASIPAQAQEVNAAPAATASASAPADLQPLLRALQGAVDAVIATQEGEKLSTELEALRIPEYQKWFLATFGPEEGAKLAAIYSETLQKTENRVMEYFVRDAARGGQITADLASGGSVPQKTEFQQHFDNAIRRVLKQPALFYRVEYRSNPDSPSPILYPLGYVTLVSGAYCLLGGNVLRALPEMPAPRLRIGGNVLAARAISKVQPVYPTEARRQHISGTVRMHAIIAKDGSIKNLEVLAGHPSLVDAALDAVRQWRYQPTLLEGEPVEIDTTIDVTFSLNRN